ncbi:TlpA disulfide reductase family protein [Rhodoflexus caldus]|uniref:TlpA disulfide reductase family protein n=1 Tax=Rhodoflexus caldus TaxID=2891236 RepID=UPI00202A1CDC|nr:TlpA disulfide reductase family protein [Rhodoflexus caldus]
MNRKTVFLLLFGAALAACQNAAENTHAEVTVIEGTIANPQPGKMVYLSRQGLEKAVPVDSVKPDDNGKFRMEVKVESPGFYSLNVYNTQFGDLVITQPAIIKVEAAGQTNGTFKVSGSPDTDYLLRFYGLEQSFRRKADSVQALAVNGQLTQEQLMEAYQSLSADAIGKAKQMIEQNPSSIVSIVVAGALDADKEIAFLQQIHQKLAQAHPTSEYVVDFGKRLEQISKTAIGQPAPEIALNDPEGKEIRLSSLRGKYVLIDFWASWCGPCRRENPNVVRMYNRFKGKDFEIFGVSLDKERDQWLKAIKDDGLTWTHVSDLKFWQSSVVPLYRIQGIPMTVLLDKNGIIIDKNLRGQALEDRLTELLK